MFASRAVWVHLVRGAIGIGAFVAAVAIVPAQPWLSVPLFALALVALRGCPLCWTLGLVQTIAARIQGRRAAGACVDGTCAIVGRGRCRDGREAA